MVRLICSNAGPKEYRRMKKLSFLGLWLVLATSCVPGPAWASYGAPVHLYDLQDARINESSGVASYSRSGDVLFTHNDSGDVARFFAVGPKGQTLATYTVLGAAAADWEDMVRGRGDNGPALYFGDIGDNLAARPFVTVYEVAEPHVDRSARGLELRVPVTGVTQLAYEDGPHDAEALIFDWRTRTVGIVTKAESGQSGAYLAEPIGPGHARLHRVATISLDKIARPAAKTDFSPTSRLMATGGDITPDGRRFVIRTYVEAFEWDVSGGVVKGLRSKPLRIRLPRTNQGEAIAYTRDGRSLVITTEQVPAPVHLIPAAS
jgi:hypothetical protein